jgi:hypothetical protein
VTCPSCRRDNRTGRRYCGGCGCNFEPACDGCGFANDAADRFCGGCGHSLRAERRAQGAAGARAAGAAVPAAAHPAAPRPAAAAAVAGLAAAGSAWEANELAALFTPAAVADAEPALPEAGINQDDVDRLFGSPQ